MRAKWKIILVLLGIVLVSALAGGVVGVKLAERAMKHRHAPETWNQTAMRTLQRRLKLTPEQAQKTQAILDSGVEEMKGIRLETIGRTNAVIERFIREIDQEITPGQRAEFEKFKNERGEVTLDLRKVEPRKP